MYRPPHFAEDRLDVTVALLRAAGYGHLVVAASSGLAATPMPYLVDDACTTVRAHLARSNPVWKQAPCEAMLIVPVTDAYVSPSWYPAKAEHGRVVPTWNYEIVHLHGRLAAHDDRTWVASLVRELTDTNEAAMPTPWSVDDAPAPYVDQMLRGIVGVELVVDRVEAKRKLSQNRDRADREGAITGLGSSPGRGASAVRSAMLDVSADDRDEAARAR